MCVCVSRFYDLKRKAKTIIYKPKAKLTETNNTKWRWAQAKKKKEDRTNHKSLKGKKCKSKPQH